MFVAKDGFLLYYAPSHSPTQAHFDTKPKGVIPLGGCTVELVERGPGKSSFGLRIQHPDFYAGRALVLAGENGEEQIAWKETLQNCSRVTMENALLGDSMIERLRAEGTAAAGGKEEEMQRLKAEALRLRGEKDTFEARLAEAAAAAAGGGGEDAAAAAAAAEEAARRAEEEAAKRAEEEDRRIAAEAELEMLKAARQTDVDRQAAELAKLEEELAAAKLASQGGSDEAIAAAEARALELEAEKSRVVAEAAGLKLRVDEMEASAEDLRRQLDDVKSQSKALKEETKERRKLEMRLRVAEGSVRKLDDALRRGGHKLDVDVFGDVRTLLSFFEERVETAKRDAQRTELIKQALQAKRRYIIGKGLVEADSSESEEEEGGAEEEDEEDGWGDEAPAAAAAAPVVPGDDDGWSSEEESGGGAAAAAAAGEDDDSDW